MTKSIDGATQLRGNLVKVGHIKADLPHVGLDHDLYIFDGYNTESGDRESSVVLFMKVDDNHILSDVSDVYDIINDADQITDRVVVTDISY